MATYGEPILDQSSYHLAANPALYEVQRENSFVFVVTDIDGIVRAGARPGDENYYITNAQNVMRYSVVSCPIPHFKQDEVAIRLGNSTLYYAGTPSFDGGNIVVNDFIGADTKSVLQAWQNLSYDVKNDTVASVDVTNYKKDCYLIELTPDKRPHRTWRILGCWITGISEGDFNAENGGKKTITASIRYDRAYMEPA